MYIVGLTGGIGSGKSAVADRFEELGIEVIDADQISRKVVEPGMPALESIKEYFGGDILEGDALNRAKLRDIIFFDIKKRKWLESLLHPLINKLIRSSLENTSSDYSILVSPLLLETNQFEICSRILVIDAKEFKKIANVIKKSDETAPHEVILVLDATTGQNALNQVEEFSKIHNLTGLIITKLDSTAKGGIVLAICKKYDLPIVALGMGEKDSDLHPFNAEYFSKALLGLQS